MRTTFWPGSRFLLSSHNLSPKEKICDTRLQRNCKGWWILSKFRGALRELGCRAQVRKLLVTVAFKWPCIHVDFYYVYIFSYWIVCFGGDARMVDTMQFQL